MIRIQELKLPLNHDELQLRQAILQRLSIAAADLRSFTVFKRAYDARKPSAIQLIYTVDVDVLDEAAALKRLSKDRLVGAATGPSFGDVLHAEPKRPAARSVHPTLWPSNGRPCSFC